jgi:ABC-type branched-subunit amino acid transport system substrate-binding protein
VPIVAPFSGAASLREPFNPYIFHLRASYQDEAGKLVQHLGTLGMTKVAILHQDDTFGKDGLAGFRKHLEAKGVQPAAIASYSRKDLKVDEALKSIAKANPQAVLMACTPKACVDFIKQMRLTGSTAKFYTLSNVNSEEFLSSLGDAGRGVVISQVMPFPWGVDNPLVKEFQAAVKASKNPPPITYGSLEGYAAAKLLVEGLRRAGNAPTREKLMAALEGMKEYDLGGMKLGYGPNDRVGSDFVEITVVGKGGKIVR